MARSTRTTASGEPRRRIRGAATNAVKDNRRCSCHSWLSLSLSRSSSSCRSSARGQCYGTVGPVSTERMFRPGARRTAPGRPLWGSRIGMSPVGDIATSANQKQSSCLRSVAMEWLERASTAAAHAVGDEQSPRSPPRGARRSRRFCWLLFGQMCLCRSVSGDVSGVAYRRSWVAAASPSFGRRRARRLTERPRPQR
jgi:hypothetical protein